VQPNPTPMGAKRPRRHGAAYLFYGLQTCQSNRLGNFYGLQTCQSNRIRIKSTTTFAFSHRSFAEWVATPTR
jgi:hypothetical protein